MSSLCVLLLVTGNTASDVSRVVPAAYPEILTVTAMGGQSTEGQGREKGEKPARGIRIAARFPRFASG